MNEKLTSKEILEQFVQRSGLLEEQAKNFIDTFQYVFLQAIEEDKIVKVSGLGTFQLVWNKPRKSVDVRTQQEIEIAGHYKLTFTPENALKERVNAEFAHLEPMELDFGQTETKKESPIEKLSQQAKDLKIIIDGIQQENNKVETENVPSKQVEVTETSEIQEVEKIKEVAESNVVEFAIDKVYVKEKLEIIKKATEVLREADEIIEVFEKIIDEPKNSTSLNNHEEIKEVIEEVIEEKTEDASDVVRRVKEMFEGKSVDVPDTSTSLSNHEEIKEEEVVVETENFPSEKIEEKIEEKTDTSTIEQPAEPEAELDEKELAQKQSAIDFFYQKPEPPIEVKANTFDYIENYEFKPKKRRCWLWWLIILAVLAAAVTAFCFLQPDLAKQYWNFTTNKATELTQKVGGWFSKSQSTDVKEDTIFADTMKVDLDTIVEPVEISQTQPVETPKTPKVSIFNEPRTYTEFITSVTMYGGNTLVKLAEEHYGHKMFWVYIYEANKDKIADPDRISAGQIVRVPKLNAKLIDLNNPACLEYAQKLHNQYLNR